MKSFANSISRNGILLGLMLWFLIWAGYNANIGELNFSGNAITFLQGFRSLFPLLAAYLAIIVLLMRFSVSIKFF